MLILCIQQVIHMNCELNTSVHCIYVDAVYAHTVQGDWDVSASQWSSNASADNGHPNGSVSNGSASNGSASGSSNGTSADATAATDTAATTAAVSVNSSSSSGEWLSRELRYFNSLKIASQLLLRYNASSSNLLQF